MGHDSYIELTKRINKMPQEAPVTDTLMEILRVLFTEEEAFLVSQLPINFISVERVSKIWKKDLRETEAILDTLADKGIMVDLAPMNGTKVYTLAPPMAGFLEFSLMRTDGKFDRKVLSELYHQYINVEDEFGTALWGLEPAIDRVFVHEEAIQEKHKSLILDYERASHIIDTASCITVGTCYCRHKMEHVGKACDNPQDVCLTFNTSAKTLSKHGIAREIDKEEAFQILDNVRQLGLVQIGDNVQQGVNWICNCCSCCCEALLGYTRFGYSQHIESNFYASVNQELCAACGICEEKCPVDAITVEEYSMINLERCIGCGVCTRFCPENGIVMERRDTLQFTPVDTFERVVIEAINTGKLHNLIFDNFHSISGRVLNRLLKTFFSIPFVNKSLVENQLRSRYITAMFGAYRSLNRGDKPSIDFNRYTHPELD
ncbi:MAG: 4Fe-4S binding protein [Candidatus Heimdallarchaeota archaeon]|nr:4Fe-4S binding protein [Candidatus Heimdallarchaeota archaeon]